MSNHDPTTPKSSGSIRKSASSLKRMFGVSRVRSKTREVPPSDVVQVLTPPPSSQKDNSMPHDHSFDSPLGRLSQSTRGPLFGNIFEDSPSQSPRVASVASHDSQSSPRSLIDTTSVFFNEPPTSFRNTNDNFVTRMCCFCSEMMVNSLPGERYLSLTCSHHAHYDCYKSMVDPVHVETLPECFICKKKTQCDDGFIQARIIREVLTSEEREGPFQSPGNIQPSSTISARYAPTPVTPVSKSLSAQLLTPPRAGGGGKEPDTISSPLSGYGTLASVINSGEHFWLRNKDNRVQQLLSPQVDIILENKDLTFGRSSPLTVPLLLEIKPPLASANSSYPRHDIPEEWASDEDFQLREAIAAEVIIFLKSRLPVFSRLHSTFGDLIVLDSFELSVDGKKRDPVQLYLFTKALLILNPDSSAILGQINLTENIVSLNKIDDYSLIIDLRISPLLELHLYSKNPIVTHKWENLLTKRMLNIGVRRLPLLQLTTNSWPFLKVITGSSNVEIPSSVNVANRPLNKHSKFSMDVLSRSIPPPLPLPVVLIVVMSLVNTTNFSSQAYTAKMKSLLVIIRHSLKPGDKLGLVFVGKNGRGEACKSGTFVGCLDPTWDGWQTIIDGLRTIEPSLPDITPDGYEEIMFGLENAYKLISMLPSSLRDNRSIIKEIVCFLQPVQSVPPTPEYWESQLRKCLEFLFDYLFTIRVVVVGSYSASHEKLIEIGAVFSKQGSDGATHDKDSNHNAVINYSFRVKRFQSLDELEAGLDDFLVGIQQILIPQVRIKLESAFPEIFRFSKVENDGEFVEFDTGHLEFNVNDLHQRTNKTISIQMRLQTKSLIPQGRSFTEEFRRFELLNFSFTCLSKAVSHSSVCANFKMTHEDREWDESIFYPLDSVSTSSIIPQQVEMADNHMSLMDFPLLVMPVSSPKDCAFSKRQLERIISSAMKRLIGAIGKQSSGSFTLTMLCESILRETMSVVFGIIRNCKHTPSKTSFSSEPDEIARENHLTYMYTLQESLKSIYQRFQGVGNSRDDVLSACQDLRYHCMLQD